mgnify:CR=1 FL=1
MERLQRELYHLYSQQLAELEYEMQVAGEPEGLSDDLMRCRRYFMSSGNRRKFGITIMRNHYTKNFNTVLGTAKQVGISRNAAEQISDDIEGEGWITFRRCGQNYRWIEARPILIEVWEGYAERVREFSNEIDFASTTFAIRGLHQVTS